MLTWSPGDDVADWDAALAVLPGGSLYQSAAWSRYRKAMGWDAVRAIGRDENNAIVAMVQMLVRRRFGLHIVWIPGGPAGDRGRWAASLVQFLRKRFGPLTYCRLNSLSERDSGAGAASLGGHWRRPSVRLGTGLSLTFDLGRSDQERIGAASANWRHNLRRSAKYDLTVAHWDNPDAAQMAAVYRDMEAFKGLGQQHSETDLRAMIEGLGECLVVIRCLDRDGNLLAFRAAGLFGDQAWDLLAAATQAARKVYASHAALWALFDACREQGARHYDLGGVDPVNNKGVFDFKHGTGARPVEYIGEWEWANVPLVAPAVGLMMKYRGLAA
jgi:hypothetical protein